MLSAHTWAVIGLCSLPLLVWLPLWLLDADRPPDNQTTHEHDDETPEPGGMLAAA